MSLSKQQMLGAVGAGVFVLCAGGLGFGVYLAWDGRCEAEQALESAVGGFRGHYEAAVFPSKRSLDSVVSNKVSYTDWYESALALAARGDRSFPVEMPPIFKQRLQREVRRMAALAGGVDGKIAAPAFLFGFEQYLGEGGVLPQEQDVPRLAVQLDTIAQVVDIFAEVGVLEVKAIQRIEKKAASDEEEDEGARRPAKAKKGAGKEADAPQETCLAYAFEFTARPAALVAVLNRLTACPRFMTVKNLSFRETADMIVEHLNAVENAKNQKASARGASGRRGRRGAPVAAEGASQGGAEAAVNPLVVDPELDAPIQVNFTLEVRDFGRAAATAPAAEDAATEAKPEPEAAKPTAEKKGDGK